MPQPRLHVEIGGEGPAIVFTHGLGDDGTTWDGQVSALQSRFTTLRWDLLGHGRSAKPSAAGEYSREIALGDLEAQIRRCSGDVVLAGHSLGGYLSLCRAIREPRGLRALVLVAAGPGFRDEGKRDRWNRGLPRAEERFGLPPGGAQLAEQPDDFVMAHLGRIELPTLLLFGSRDETYAGALRYLESKLVDAKSLVVEGAGHHPHRSHPDAVNAAIVRFLDSIG